MTGVRHTRAAHIGRGLAYAFCAGEWEHAALVARGMDALQLSRRPPPALPQLVRLTLRLFPQRPVGRSERLGALLARSVTLREALAVNPRWRMRHWRIPEASMATPVRALAGLDLPPIAHERALAEFLGLSPEQLDWFADPRRLNRATRAPKLRHYQYRWVPKRSGAYRLIEAPKQRLKQVQRVILDRILAHVPLHDACHGQRAGRSVLSYVTPHVGREVVLALDLSDFYVCVREARVRAIFAALGYPDRVAALLSALCCTPTPEDVLCARPLSRDALESGRTDAFLQKQRLRDAHLPQGAPTSPALANLAAYRLDLRYAALAKRVDCSYTRYADDLAFSGDARFASLLPRLLPRFGAIALEEGFALRHRKTRRMGQSQRQQLCGVVLNHSPSLPRAELRRLEATLTNCVRHGVAEQNRAGVPDFRAHLRGRVAWAVQLAPARAAHLQALFDQIQFDREP